MSVLAETKVTLAGCPCGCKRALCPRCYGDYTNVLEGLLGMCMGVLMCHDCRMNYHLGEMNAMIRGHYDGQLKLNAETVERRAKNRERLRPFGFVFDAEQEGQEADGAGLS